MSTPAPLKTTAAMTVVLALAACAPEQTAEFVDAGPTETAESSGETDAAPEGAQDPQPAESPEETESSEPAAEDGEVFSVQRTFLAGGDEVTLEAHIHPVVRQDELAAVHLQFDYLEGEANWLGPRDFLQGVVSMSQGAGGQVRLVDTEAMTVSHVGNAEHPGSVLGSIAAGENRGGEGDLLEWVGYFDAPEGDSIHLLLPEFGLIEVPVVDGELDDVEPEDEDVQEIIEEMTEVETQTYDLMSWRESHHYAVDIEGEETTVNLPSDVLFDVDSSDLSAEADEALEAAAQEMSGTEGGELQIVGHTDNVLDENYNQVLSEERAEAVQQRLAELTDLAAFDSVEVRGESFREPIADNDTDEGRSLNRRVDLQFTTVQALEDTRDYSGEVPEASGVVAAEGEVLEYTDEDGGSFELEVESLERSGSVMVGTIRVEQLTDEGHLHDPLCTALCQPNQNEQRGVNMPQLLVGEYRVDPLRYFRDGEVGAGEDEDGFDRAGSSVLGDVFIGGPGGTSAGDYATVHILWPAVGAETVSVDVPSEDDYEYGMLARTVGVTPWRLEDIPVTEAGGGVSGEDDGSGSD